MSAEVYLVAEGLPGRLFIMPCPVGDHLSESLEVYQARGVDVIVSMLAVEEAAMLGLAGEEHACDQAGIAFVSSPVNDLGLPAIDVFDALVGRIVGLLRHGQSVAVHCRAGIGRSGMVTAATLVELGFDPDVAIDQVSRSRGVSIPDTVEQGKFIADFARRMK